MSDPQDCDRSSLNRREMLRLSTAMGVGAVLPGHADAVDRLKGAGPQATAGACSTPRTAVATTQYGKVRGYVDDGVLTFKGVPYGPQPAVRTGGCRRSLPRRGRASTPPSSTARTVRSACTTG